MLPLCSVVNPSGMLLSSPRTPAAIELTGSGKPFSGLFANHTPNATPNAPSANAPNPSGVGSVCTSGTFFTAEPNNVDSPCVDASK